MTLPTRRTVDTTTTYVDHIATPMGRARENGPHLSDLRLFVDACDGLPGDILVRIDTGHMGESGRYNVTFHVTYMHPPPAPPDEEPPCPGCVTDASGQGQ